MDIGWFTSKNTTLVLQVKSNCKLKAASYLLSVSHALTINRLAVLGLCMLGNLSDGLVHCDGRNIGWMA